MVNIIQSFFLYPNPMGELLKKYIKKFKVGSYKQRVLIGAVERPYYGYCVYQAAILAKKLNYNRVSVLELGVAGGKGLLNLEYHAEQVEKLLSIDIDIYGFDTAEGLQQPLDYRDLPYNWKKGEYKMKVQELRDNLKKATLVLGDIKDTGKSFFQEHNPSPIAAIMYDLDYYSATVDALKMLDADEKYYLPRVFCYFDDVIGDEWTLYNDYTGERLAINEFNELHQDKKLAIAYYLRVRPAPWCHKIWIFHYFKHKKYNDFIGRKNKQLPL